MTFQAKRPHILQVAFAAAFSHGNDVIGIPQTAAPAFFQLPFFQKLPARPVVELAKFFAKQFRVGAAPRTKAVVARENLLAQVTRICTQFPFVHTVGGAKGPAAARHFDGTPSAQGSAIPAFRERTRFRPPAFADSLCAGRQIRLAARTRARAYPR